MASRAERISGALGRFLTGRALELTVLVVALLVLFGAVTGSRVFWLLVLFVAARGLYLVSGTLRQRLTLADWDRLRGEISAAYGELDAQQVEELAEELALPHSATPEQVVEAQLGVRKRQYRPPRPLREAAGEGIGLLTFCVLVPFVLALYTRDIVSLRANADFFALATAALCVGLYAWPLRWEATEGRVDRQMLWWCLPAIPALVLVHAGVTTRHVYLDPTREDRLQLRAEHVLSLEDNVTAGAYADWVFEYALALEEEGDWARAAEFYRQGLRLAPFSDAARARLVALEGRLDPGPLRSARDPMDPRPRAGEVAPAEFARLPFWLEGQPLRALPSCEVGAGLEQVPSTTIVVLRIGDVAPSITEAIGHVMQEELALPACLVPEVLELPSATRYRGLVFGRQWSLDSLVEAMLPMLRRAPDAPLKFLLITPVDVYLGASNFVFSTTYAWGAVLSYARFGDFASEPELVRHRTAKQSMGALVKSFDVPISPDPNCVTSYTNGLPQFDAKGNRLNSESYSMFRERVDSIDRRWRTLRAP